MRLAGRQLVAAVHELFDTDAECGGDACEISGDLTGATGLPLCDRAAGDADRGGQLILGPLLVFPSGADSGADVAWVGHCGMLRQLD